MGAMYTSINFSSILLMLFLSFARKYFHGRDYVEKILSLRKPEPTSLTRATSLNKTNVSSFFDKLEECLKRAPYSPSDIYNADETGCMTVQSVRNVKVIARHNEKQVGKLTSGERGALVTILYAVNAAGNSVPPMLVFPQVKLRDYMTRVRLQIQLV